MLKLIKRPLKRGEKVICKNTGGQLYEGIVTTTQDTNPNKAIIKLNRPIVRAENREETTIWEVTQNDSKTWDGFFDRQMYGWGSRSTPTGRIYNRATGGSWLYTDVIENWKKEIGDFK